MIRINFNFKPNITKNVLGLCLLSLTRQFTIAVAISGGVDSAMAAYYLKKSGHDIFGIYMSNWDNSDESSACTSDKDIVDARRVCDILKISLVEVRFVKDYWNRVFSRYIEGQKSVCIDNICKVTYAKGITPNPDILCNREIKFDVLLKEAKKHGAATLATGHYARMIEFASERGVYGIINAKDHWKDQTYFLSMIEASVLPQITFPIGHHLKTDIRDQASTIFGNFLTSKPSSKGICFIGKRDMKTFLSNYLDCIPGKFIDIDTNTIIGSHTSVELYTIGERTRVSGLECRYYVIKKDLDSGNIHVSKSLELLRKKDIYSTQFSWIHRPVDDDLLIDLYCKFRHPAVNDLGLSPCALVMNDVGNVHVRLKDGFESVLVVAGQVLSLYRKISCKGLIGIDEDSEQLVYECLGGGVIVDNFDLSE